MTVTHEVGAVWRIIDQGTPTLRLIGDTLTSVDKIAKALMERLEKLGTFKFLGTNDALAELGRAVDKVATQGEAAGLKLKEIGDQRFAGLNRGLTGVATRLDTIEARARAAGTALGSMPSVPALAGRGGGRRPGSGGGGGGSHPEENARLRDHAHGRHGAGADLGMFGFIGGEATGEAFADILKHGMELQHVQMQMVMGGMKAKEVAEATAAAWAEASKYGLNVTQVMGDIKELRFPFGSTEHAINFIDPLEKMRVVLNSVHEGSGTESANSVYELARAGELKGLQTPEDFLKYFDDMTKVISATGGKVTPKDFMQAMKYGRVASLGWNEEFTTKYLPTLMQSLGPSGAGTAAMSLFGTLAQGKVGKRALEQMQDIGLIGDPSKIIYDKVGPAGFKPGAIKGTDEFVQNPAIWAQQTLLPLLTSKFGDLGNDANRLHAAEGLGGLFGNRMSAQAIAEFILRMQSINKDANLTEQARGIGGAGELLARDPTAAMNNFKASWENLLTSLGGSSVQPAIAAMNTMSSGLNALSKFGEEHPDAMRSIVGAIGGLTAGLGALAIAGLAVFLPGGLFVAAMTSLGGALLGIAAMNYDKIWSALDNVAHFFTSLGDKIAAAIAGFVNTIESKLKSIPGLGHLFDRTIPEARTKDDRVGAAQPHWYDGLGSFGGGFIPMSFETGGAANDNSPLVDAIAAGFLKAFAQLQGGGISGIGEGGSGLINASWEGGSGGFRLPGGTDLSGGAAPGEHADFIRKYAASIGIDPRVAAAVAKSEGLGHFVGDYGTSFGDFQMHFGGSGIRGMNAGGLGDVFNRTHPGIDARDPKNWRVVDAWALDYAKKHGWGDWHGAARIGVHGFDGTDYPRSGSAPPLVTAPPKKVTPGAPASSEHIEAAVTQAMSKVQLAATFSFDHRAQQHVAKFVAPHIASAMRFPTGMGGPDNHSHFVSPGTPVMDAA